MMGDEMAIRSGGIYGNPESRYTLARPTNFGSSVAANASLIGRVGKSLLTQYSAWEEAKYTDKQLSLNLSSLLAEKKYNLENYQQRIADTVASNKMSFYSSGLDINSGTAASVVLNNQNAMLGGYGIMERNYIAEEKSLRNAKKANERNLTTNLIDNALSIF